MCVMPLACSCSLFCLKKEKKKDTVNNARDAVGLQLLLVLFEKKNEKKRHS
jgi:hypothetical protein